MVHRTNTIRRWPAPPRTVCSLPTTKSFSTENCVWPSVCNLVICGNSILILFFTSTNTQPRQSPGHTPHIHLVDLSDHTFQQSRYHFPSFWTSTKYGVNFTAWSFRMLEAFSMLWTLNWIITYFEFIISWPIDIKVPDITNITVKFQDITTTMRTRSWNQATSRSTKTMVVKHL